MLSAIAEIFSVWFLAAAIGALAFGAFAAGQKKLAEQQGRQRHGS